MDRDVRPEDAKGYPAPPAYEVRGIRKSFSAVRALDGVDLEIRAGEIHAIVGENGAGKSTLIKVLSGALAPDAGEIRIHGERAAFRGPRDARALGIAVSHQDPELFDWRAALENCFLQARLPGRWLISWGAARAEARRTLERLGAGFRPGLPARVLTAAERRLVSIAGALLVERPPSGRAGGGESPRRGGGGLLILDEPTAPLSGSESRRLFDVILEVRARGASVLYVSHRLEEVLDLADRVTVLRDGRVVLTAETSRLDASSLVEAMVGRRLVAAFPRPPPPAESAPIALEVKDLSDPDGAFRDVTFTLRRGEVLGLYGLIGAGRSELGQAVAGLRKAGGSVRASGRIAYLPEDRLRDGNLPGLSLRENISISSLAPLARGLLIDRVREREAALSWAEELDIRAPGIEARIETLSGGNQQKALIARCLATGPEVLVLDEPTQGVDVGAKAEIHARVGELARAGRAILLISSDLPEVLGMSHRVAVFREGRIAQAFDLSSASGTTGTTGAREDEVGRAAFPMESRARAAGAPEGARSPGGFRGAAGARRILGGLLARRETALILIMAFILGATEIRSPGYLLAGGAREIASGAAPLALGSLGETLVIASGAIDISIGPVLALSATAATLWTRDGGAIPSALLLAVLLGAALASINAAISWWGRLHPILTTLGTLWVFHGAFLLWTGGDWLILPPPLLELATGGPFGVPASAWGALVFAGALALFLRSSRLGRACLMVGDNPRAARLHGLPIARARFTAFAILGAAVGLAGVFHTARYGQVQGNTGLGFELLAIAAAVLGGARVSGGHGTVTGALLGAGLIALLQEARAVWGIHERWQLVAVGSLMLGALLLESAMGRLTRGRPA